MGQAQARTQVQTLSQAPDASQWQLALRLAPPDLRAYVTDACGYVERTAGRLARREFPHPGVVVIFEFGPPLRVFEAGSLQRYARHAGGFVAGLADRFTLTEHAGFQHGLQWNLTPLGARLFFGLPMTELTGRAVALSDLDSVDAGTGLTERLADLPDWQARFDLLDQLMRTKVAAAKRPTSLAPVVWAAQQITSGAARDIGALTRKLGYSPRHAIALFREHVGLPPKRLARVVRFHQLVQHLRKGADASWAQLALRFGYFDQAHLARDVRAFAGLSPSAMRGSLIDIEALAAR